MRQGSGKLTEPSYQFTFVNGGWADVVTEEPHYPTYVPQQPYSGDTVRLIGYLHPRKKKHVIRTSLLNEMPDPTFTQFIRDKNIEFDWNTTHSYCRGDMEATHNQLRLIDQPYHNLSGEDIKLLDQASEDVYAIFERFGVQGCVISPEQVVYNRGSSPGSYMPYGLDTKGQYVDAQCLHTHLPMYLKEYAKGGFPLWNMQTKSEYLPRGKITSKNLRVFCFPNVAEYFISSMLYSYMNNDMINKLKNFCGLGSAFQYGGFHKIIANIASKAIKYQGDCTKYDKLLRSYMLYLMAHLRRRLAGPLGIWRASREAHSWFKEHNIPFDIIDQLLDITYRNSVKTNVLLPDGSVYNVMCSLKSGFVNTSSDGTGIHMHVIVAWIRQVFTQTHDKDPSIDDILWTINALIYSDDHIVSVPETLTDFVTFEYRRDFYRKFGLDLKQADDVVSDDVSDLTFLGAKPRLIGNTYYPVYSIDRVKSSLAYMSTEEMSTEIRYMKTVALYLLVSCSEDPFVEIIEQYLRYQYSEHIWRQICREDNNLPEEYQMIREYFLRNSILPTRTQAMAIWDNKESSNTTQPPIIEGCTIIYHGDGDIYPEIGETNTNTQINNNHISNMKCTVVSRISYTKQEKMAKITHSDGQLDDFKKECRKLYAENLELRRQLDNANDNINKMVERNLLNSNNTNQEQIEAYVLTKDEDENYTFEKRNFSTSNSDFIIPSWQVFYENVRVHLNDTVDYNTICQRLEKALCEWIRCVTVIDGNTVMKLHHLCKLKPALFKQIAAANTSAGKLISLLENTTKETTMYADYIHDIMWAQDFKDYCNRRIGNTAYGNDVHNHPMKPYEEGKIVFDLTNKAMHSTNGNTTKGTPKLSRRFGDPTTVYPYSEVPTGVYYAKYSQYLISMDLPGFAAQVQNDMTVMSISTIGGGCLDCPEDGNITQVIGYIWYMYVPTATQESYDEYMSTQDVPMMKSRYPLNKMLINVKQFSGYTEYQAAQRNRMMHSQNGNTTTDNKIIALKDKQMIVLTNPKNMKEDIKKKIELDKKKKAIDKNKVKIKPLNALVVHKHNVLVPKPGINTSLHKTMKKMNKPRFALIPEVNDSIHTTAVKTIAMNMIMPDEKPSDLRVVRYAGNYGDTATAVAAPYRKFNSAIAGTSDGTNFIGPDGFYVFRRDPYCSMIYYDPNTAGSVMNYVMYAMPDSGNGFNPTPPGVPTSTFARAPFGTMPLKYCYMTTNQSYQPHGIYWYPLERDGYHYFHASANHNISINVAGVSNPNGVEVGFALYVDNNGVREMVSFQTQSLAHLTSYTWALKVATSGYYTIATMVSLEDAGGEYANWNIQVNNYYGGDTPTSVMCHLPLVDLETNSQRMYYIRILSLSGMLTNQTNLYNVEGSVCGQYVPGNRSWCELIDTKTNVKMLDSSMSTNISQETEDNGCRVWVPPASNADFDLISVNMYLDGVFQGGAGQLYTKGNYAAIYYQNNSNSAMNVFIHDAKRVEYSSENQWVEYAYSRYTQQEWDLAMESIKRLTHVTTNPLHFAILAKQLLTSIGKYAEPVGVWVGKAARALSETI
jgi:hypothetical protein